MHEQLLRVPVAALPPGLTSLRAMHVQFMLDDSAHGGAAAAAGAAAAGVAAVAPPALRRRSLDFARRSLQDIARRSVPHPGARACGVSGGLGHSLAAVFGCLQELDWTHCDHVAADRLLERALPHCAKLQLLHISGPGGALRRGHGVACWALRWRLVVAAGCALHGVNAALSGQDVPVRPAARLALVAPSVQSSMRHTTPGCAPAPTLQARSTTPPWATRLSTA